MTEHEKDQQIGKLVEEYSHAKGKLNHVIEKLNQFQASCAIMANAQSFQSLRVQDGKLSFNRFAPQPHGSLDGLLNHSQLTEVVEEKYRFTEEVKSLRDRLVAVAPHLF